MPSYPYQLTIGNPGAEDSGVSPWIDDNGTGLTLGKESSNPRHGSQRWKQAFTSSPASAHQDITLDSSLFTDIDAGLLYAWFFMPQVSGSAGGTFPRLGFFSTPSTQIGGDSDGPAAQNSFDSIADTWMNNRVMAAVPSGTRYIRLTMATNAPASGRYDDVEAWLTDDPAPAVSSGLDLSGFDGDCAVPVGPTDPGGFDARVSLPDTTESWLLCRVEQYAGIEELRMMSNQRLYQNGPWMHAGRQFPYWTNAQSVGFPHDDYEVTAQYRVHGYETYTLAPWLSGAAIRMPRPMIGAALRVGGVSGSWRGIVAIADDESDDLLICRKDWSSTAALVGLASAADVFAGMAEDDIWNIKIGAVGTTFKAKAWKDGTAEPDWQVTTVYDDVKYKLGRAAWIIGRNNGGISQTHALRGMTVSGAGI